MTNPLLDQKNINTNGIKTNKDMKSYGFKY